MLRRNGGSRRDWAQCSGSNVGLMAVEVERVLDDGAAEVKMAANAAKGDDKADAYCLVLFVIYARSGRQGCVIHRADPGQK